MHRYICIYMYIVCQLCTYIIYIHVYIYTFIYNYMSVLDCLAMDCMSQFCTLFCNSIIHCIETIVPLYVCNKVYVHVRVYTCISVMVPN